MEPLYKHFDKFFEDSVRIPGVSAWIVLCGYHIGETVLFCAFADEFKKYHGNEIIVVATPKHSAIMEMYGHNFIKVVYIADEAMRVILRSGYIPQDRMEIDQPFSACWIDRGFRESDGIRFLWKYTGRGGLSESDFTRFILHLPWDAQLESPKISSETEREVIEFSMNLGLNIGRSVLLCPINNSAPKLPQVFWNAVAKCYIENGFKVFTNMGGLNPFNGIPEMPIPGTIPVNLPIEWVISFCRLAGNVVTGTNGMSVLIMMASRKNYKITQLIQHSKSAVVGHSSRGFRSPSHPEKGNELFALYQFAFPELCIGSNFLEYIIPHDEAECELERLGRVVARGDASDSSHFRRPGHKMGYYLEENFDWLFNLGLKTR